MKRWCLLVFVGLASSCGKPASKSPFVEPYYTFKADDGQCNWQVVVDGNDQIWTDKSCVSPTFTATNSLTAAESTSLVSDFQGLKRPPDTTCPGGTGGSASGTAFLLMDGQTSSEVTLSETTSSGTLTWIACQYGGELVPPYQAIGYILTGQS